MKLIILNRDGVINYEHLTPIRSPEEWIPIPGSLDAIARLTYADYRIVVKTNELNSSLGKKSIETLNRIHEKMHRFVNDAGGAIEAIFILAANTNNTKSNSYSTVDLLNQIAQRAKTNLTGIPIVSSNLADLEAAQTLNALGIYINPEDETKTSLNINTNDKLVFSNLAAATDHLLTLSL